jgi:hypothetical protein
VISSLQIFWQILCSFIISPMHATCPAHFIIFYLITMTIFDEKYTSRTFSLFTFFPASHYLLHQIKLINFIVAMGSGYVCGNGCLTGPLSIPQMIYEWVWNSGVYYIDGGGDRRTRRKTFSNTTLSLQIPHGLTWMWTSVSTVRNQWLWTSDSEVRNQWLTA